MPSNDILALAKSLQVVLAPSNTVLNAHDLIEDLLMQLLSYMDENRNGLV